MFMQWLYEYCQLKVGTPYGGWKITNNFILRCLVSYLPRSELWEDNLFFCNALWYHSVKQPLWYTMVTACYWVKQTICEFPSLEIATTIYYHNSFSTANKDIFAINHYILVVLHSVVQFFWYNCIISVC